MNMEFTKEQLSDWKRFEKVRKSGKWNMFFPEARRTSGLDPDRYSFVMKHFTELKEAIESSPVSKD